VVGLALVDPDLPLPLMEPVTEPLLEPCGLDEPVVDGALVTLTEPVDFAPVAAVGVAVGLAAAPVAVVVSAFR
jgi:hypothetical protein